MLAVTGASGVGKSSLVNALRKVKDTDPDAAKTGVKETTMEPNMYRFRGTAGLFDQRFYRSFEKGMELRPKEQILLQNVSETVDGRNAEVISIKREKVKVRLDGGSVIEINLSQAAGLNLVFVSGRGAVYFLPLFQSLNCQLEDAIKLIRTSWHSSVTHCQRYFLKKHGKKPWHPKVPSPSFDVFLR